MEGSTTLEAVLEAVGAELIEILAAPRGLDVSVSEPVILDLAGGEPVAAGDLLLGVGIRDDGEDALHVLRLAAAGQAAALLVKPSGTPSRVVQAAEAAGVALGVVPPGTAWGQLFTLLRTACDASRATLWSANVTPALGDLFALANAVASTLGGATTIEDRNSRVLAYSSLDHPLDRPRRDTILGRRVPAAWVEALNRQGIFKRLYQNGEVVRIERLSDSDESISRLAVAVRAGGEILGSIWVAEGEQGFVASAEEALRGAAEIAALHLLHHRARPDVERLRRGELLRSILAGELPLTGLGALGLEKGTPLNVLAFEAELGHGPDAEVLRDRVVAVLGLHAELYRRSASVVAIGDVVYLLLPVPEGTDVERIVALGRELAQQVETATKLSVRAGIGCSVRDIRDAHESREQADRVLEVMRQTGRRGVAHALALNSQIALARLEALAAREPVLRSGKLERLAEHDATRDTAYVATLRAYLDAFGDVPAAAARLHIHANTLRYRLARLVEIAGIDLEDPDERLVAHLQLRLGRRPDGE